MQRSGTRSDQPGPRQAPAIFATRNPDATMHLTSLSWETLPDGTMLLECRDGTTTVENLRRDTFCWVVLHRGRLPAQDPDDRTEIHLIGKGHLEPGEGSQRANRVMIRFCPDP